MGARMGLVAAALALLSWASCDEPPMPGEGCDVADQMLCGKQGGTNVALLCTPRAAGPNQWTYVTNCNTCDHVLNCKTELICNGTNVANSGLHCDVQGVGACDVNNNAHLLKCETDSQWTVFNDCSTQGKVCGKLPDGNLGCI
ncbi:MAG TPA: hypothetical protein VFF06_25320 [Polyangia bacterium]|nr:hypothetical protein [Polyangia bacterium]